MPLRRLLAIVRARFDARAIALCRIAVGMAALGQGLRTQELFIRMYSPEVARAPLVPGLPELTSDMLPFYLLAWLVAAACFTLGVLTTVSGAVLSTALAYQLALDLNLYSNHAYLMLLAIGLLTLARSGTALSFDSRFRARTVAAATVPYTWVFALRFQLSAVYFFSAIQKLNERFLSGAVLQRVLEGGDTIPEPLVRLMAAGVVLTELFLALALWIQPVRRWAFAVGFALHACIPVAMVSSRRDLALFSVLTLGMYFAFLPRSPHKLLVASDASCAFCSTWLRMLRRLDWLDRLDVRGSSAGAATASAPSQRRLTVVADRRTLGGYDAIVEIAHALPLTLFWAPLLTLRPVHAAGSRMYDSLAARAGCTAHAPEATLVTTGRA